MVDGIPVSLMKLQTVGPDLIAPYNRSSDVYSAKDVTISLDPHWSETTVMERDQALPTIRTMIDEGLYDVNGLLARATKAAELGSVGFALALRQAYMEGTSSNENTTNATSS